MLRGKNLWLTAGTSSQISAAPHGPVSKALSSTPNARFATSNSFSFAPSPINLWPAAFSFGVTLTLY